MDREHELSNPKKDVKHIRNLNSANRMKSHLDLHRHQSLCHKSQIQTD
jgi:hypothetical protein